MFTKYQKVQDSKVLSPEEHDRMEKALHREAKTSARDLTSDELKRVNQALQE